MIPKEFKIITIEELVKRKNNVVITLLNKEDVEVLRDLIGRLRKLFIWLYLKNFMNMKITMHGFLKI